MRASAVLATLGLLLLPAVATAQVIDIPQQPDTAVARDSAEVFRRMQAEANVVRVADDVKRRLEDIRSKLPEGVTLDIVYDQSVFVKNGINGMIRDGVIGGVLAFLVLIAFQSRPT